MSDEKKQDIKVNDRRHFDREGNVIREDQATAGAGTQKMEEKSPDPPEKIDFISILFSYIHTALIYLGDLEDPLQKKTSQNLEGAQQMIDILELMQQKTKGNLSKEEMQYLESALYDLRMRFMTKTKLIK